MQADPLIQMQQQELAIKQRAQQAKEAKDAADIKLRAKQVDIDAMKAAGQITTQRNIAEGQMKIQAASKLADLQHERALTSLDRAHQREMQQNQPQKEKPTKGE